MESVTLNQLYAPSGAHPPFTRPVRVVRIEPARNVVWVSFPGAVRVPKQHDLARFRHAIEQGRLCSIVDKMAPHVLAYDEAPPSSRKKCEEGWASIQYVLEHEAKFFDEDARAALVREQAKMSGCDLSHVYRLISRYYEGGQTKFALMPRYTSAANDGDGRSQGEGGSGKPMRRGRPPREAPPDGESAFVFTDEVKQKVIDFLMDARRFATFEGLFDAVTRELFQEVVEGQNQDLPIHRRPTRDQIRYLVEQMDKGFVFTKRQLRNEFNLTLRPIEGGGRALAFGAGHEYQVDATGGQVQLVSAHDRCIQIGAATIYLVVDICSSAIPGFHVTLRPPSWEAARFALFHAFQPKAESCRMMGLEGITDEHWPMSGLPIRILGDRGELICDDAEQIVEEGLNCDLVNARTRRGDDKACVERMFGTLKTALLKALPGWGPKSRSRDGKAPRADACLNIYELTKLVAAFCVWWNHHPLSEGALPDWIAGTDKNLVTPLDLWNYSLQNHVGGLRKADPELLYYHLLPKRDAEMHRDGVKFGGSIYSSPELDHLGLRVRARRDGVSRQTVHVDEGRPDHVWLWLPKQKRMIECMRRDRAGDRKEWSFDDAQRVEDDKKDRRSRAKTRSEAARSALERLRHEVEAKARAERREAGDAAIAGADGVRANRDAEKAEDDERVRLLAGQAPAPALDVPTPGAGRASDSVTDEFLGAFPE